jgi:hypothetical protein
MNETLIRLAKNAQVEHCISHVRLQEFADLIVKECLSFCEYESDRFDEYDSGMGERARIIRESIRDHFGVEQ